MSIFKIKRLSVGVGSFYYILLVGVCVWLTLGLLSLPCRYRERITVGEWVASIIFG